MKVLYNKDLPEPYKSMIENVYINKLFTIVSPIWAITQELGADSFSVKSSDGVSIEIKKVKNE